MEKLSSIGQLEWLRNKILAPKKEGIIENERFRLLWGGGLPAWFALKDFNYLGLVFLSIQHNVL